MNVHSNARTTAHSLALMVAIVHLRRSFLMPAYGIAAQLGLAYSTTCRYLRKRDILPPEKPRRSICTNQHCQQLHFGIPSRHVSKETVDNHGFSLAFRNQDPRNS